MAARWPRPCPERGVHETAIAAEIGDTSPMDVLPPLPPARRAALARALALTPARVEAAERLLRDGATVPFVVRYRQAATGSMGEGAVVDVLRALKAQAELEARREVVLRQLDKASTTPPSELLAAVRAAPDLVTLEDLYLPYKPSKSGSLADAARELGLGPVAERIWAGTELSDGMISAELCGLGIPDAPARLGHILAEKVAEAPACRAALRDLFWERAGLSVSGVKKRAAAADGKAGGRGGGRGGGKGGRDGGGRAGRGEGRGADPSELEGSVARARDLASHRVLAINRAEREKTVRVGIDLPTDAGVRAACRHGLPTRRHGRLAAMLEAAAADAYGRLLCPAMNRELRRRLTERAELAAIDVFARNLRALLLVRPVRGTIVLGIDPGYTSGCKLAVLDPSGGVLEAGVARLNGTGRDARAEGIALVRRLIVDHAVGIVAIGNGTASRPTQEAVAEALRLPPHLPRVRIALVSEAGASVLSVSETAENAEAPRASGGGSLDVGARGAASIGRRLQVAEITPRSHRDDGAVTRNYRPSACRGERRTRLQSL